MPNELDSRSAARQRSSGTVAAIYGALAEIVTGLGALGDALAGGERAAIERAVHDVVTAWTLVLSAIDAFDDTRNATRDDRDDALGRARRALPAAAAVVDQLFDRALGLPDRGLHRMLQRLQCETRILLGGVDRVLRQDGVDDARLAGRAANGR